MRDDEKKVDWKEFDTDDVHVDFDDDDHYHHDDQSRKIRDLPMMFCWEDFDLLGWDIVVLE